MKVRRFMFGVAAALCVGANANAAIIIPTNQNGADVDVREHEIIDDFGSTIATRQRGAVQELNTAGINTTAAATGDRSNVMYMKFDINGLPNHVSNPGFWADKNLFFRGYVRNTNLTENRLKFPTQPAGALPTHIVNFDIRGLEPGHVYADDPGGTTARVDRSGNAYVSQHYEYNWDEGTGTGIASDPNQGSGITFVDAPGITPFCMAAGSCNTSTYGGAATDINQSLGIFDDFNSDTRLLGNWQWPLPLSPGGPGRYPVGLPLEYTDSNGNLKQLVFDAQDAGRTSVTLLLNLGVDTLLDTTSTSSGDGPGPGVFPNNTFLNHSYLFIPKEKTTLENDNNFDPDGSTGLGAPTGSPYSCDGSTGAGLTNCPGHTLGQNPLATGPFSPQLIVRVPEPTSMVLFVLGSLVLGAVRRRK